jgi:PAS domain S-box-containing protein
MVKSQATGQLRSLRGLILSFVLLILTGFGALSAYRYVQTNQATIEVSRLFLHLERTLGYDGFIHNFKNFVLRPEDNRYYEQAKDDLVVARETMGLLTSLTNDLGVPNTLEDLSQTIETYGAKLEELSTLNPEAMSSRAMDERIRISDVKAGRAIRSFEQQVEVILKARQAEYLFFFILTLTLAAILLCGIFAFLLVSGRKSVAYASELEKQSQMLRRAEAMAKLGRWESNLQGTVHWSASMMRMMGIDKGDFTGTREQAWDLVHPEDRGKVRLAMRRAIEGDGHLSCIHRMIRPDGETIIVNDIGEGIRGPKGEIIGFSGIIQDVTDIVELEDRLRHAEKMEAIGNLAGGVAHDFNNLLAIILGNLELLEETDERTEIARYARAAHEATEKGAKLTRDMLGFARKSELQPTMTNLNDLLRESQGLWQQALSANIVLETSFVAGPWSIEIDRDLVQNAVLNLIVNSRDAMPDGGRITIETANVRIDDEYIDARGEEILPGRYAMLAVTDTGSGIAPKDIKRIFEPFFTTKPVGEGSGIGLSMVMGFMRQSKGTILVYSEVGIGTTFKMYFQTLSGAVPQQPGQTEKIVGVGKGDGARILVVEDETAVLTVIEEALTKAGFDVQTARSGDEAISLWPDADGFDVLLTDIVMPGNLQGTHLAKKMREMRPDLQVVFMSGYATEATVHGNGVRPDDGRLMKPVSKSDLIVALNKAVRQSVQE